MKKGIAAILFILFFIIAFAACDKVDFSNNVVDIEILEVSGGYFAGDDFVFDSVMFRYTYADGRSESRKSNADMIKGVGELTAGAHTAELTFGGKTVEFTYYVGGTIAYVATAGGYINGRSNQRILYGGTGALVEAVPNTGYQFDRWSDGEINPKRREVNVEAWTTITAIFAPLECIVNFYTEWGELLDTQNVIYGELFEAISPPVGKEISGYHLRSSGVKLNTFAVFNSMDIQVRLSPVQLTVTYIGGQEPSRVFDYGEALTFPEAFSEGERLKQWEDSDGNIYDDSHIVTEDITVIAVFIAGVHLVTFYSEGIVLFNYEITHGNMLGLVSNPTKENKTFVHWIDQEENIVNHNTIINNDMQLTAVWDDLYYLASFIVEYGQTDDVKVYAGDPVLMPITPSRQGYEFVGWYSDSELSAEFIFGNEIFENVNIYAKWQPISITIKYVLMYSGQEIIKFAYYDEILDLIQPEREAFNFVGWYTDQTLLNTYEATPLTSSITLFAKWENKTFGVNILPLEGGSITILSSLPILYGGILNYRVVPDAGYRVTMISANSYNTPITQMGVVDRAVVNVTSEQTLSAQFERIPVYISVTVASGGSANYTGDFTVLYGDSLSISITPDVGYSIGTVRVNQITTSVVNGILTITNIIAPQTVNIQFAISQHSVTVVAPNATSTLPDNQIVLSHGSDVSFIISALDNFYIESILIRKLVSGTIIHVDVTDPLENAVNIDNITENIRVEATIKGSIGTINAIASAGGSISPSGQSNVNFGDTLIFNVTPDAGYQVADFVFNGVSLGKITEYEYSPVSIYGDEINVTFELITLYVTASYTGNGGISMVGISSVSYGGSLTYTITAADNHHIDYLLVDGTAISIKEKVTEYTFATITSNHTISAVFVIDTYTFDATIVGNGRLTLGSGAGAINITTNTQITVNHGTPLYIYANNGNHISYLNINQIAIDIGGLSGGYIGQITENTEIVTGFELNIYSVSKTINGNGAITVADTINHGNNLLIEFAPDEGYVFSKLFINGTRVYPSGNSYTVNNVLGNITINIEYVILVLNISVSYGSGGSIEYQSSVNYGTSSTITIQAADNHHISQIISSSGNYHEAVGQKVYIIDLTNITSDFALEVQFAIDTFNISFSVGTGGHVRIDNGAQYTGNFVIEVEYGEHATFTIISDTGQEINSLIIDGVSVTLSTLIEFDEVDEDHTVAITFATKTYTISVMSMVNGTVTPSAYSIAHGGSVTLTIQPASGYRLNELKINNVTVAVSNNTYIITNITRNTTINATFVKL